MSSRHAALRGMHTICFCDYPSFGRMQIGACIISIEIIPQGQEADKRIFRSFPCLQEIGKCATIYGTSKKKPLAAEAWKQDYLGQGGTEEYGEFILSEYQGRGEGPDGFPGNFEWAGGGWGVIDRKSTRLNSSHDQMSDAVFCFSK